MPMWSSVMTSHVKKYRTRISNNPVESYFKDLKQNLLMKKIHSTSELSRALLSKLRAAEEEHLPKANASTTNPTTSSNKTIIERYKRKRNRHKKGAYCQGITNTKIQGVLLDDFETNNEKNNFNNAFTTSLLHRLSLT